MTADGTYRSSTRVTTAAELESLPVGSVVQSNDLPKRARASVGVKAPASMRGWAWTKTDADAWWGPDNNRFTTTKPEVMIDFLGPLTVLFRPDAPQPATTGDTVTCERCGLDEGNACRCPLTDEPRPTPTDDGYKPASWISPAHAAGYLTGAMGHISGSPHITPELLNRARTMARHVIEAADYLEGAL